MYIRSAGEDKETACIHDTVYAHTDLYRIGLIIIIAVFIAWFIVFHSKKGLAHCSPHATVVVYSDTHFAGWHLRQHHWQGGDGYGHDMPSITPCISWCACPQVVYPHIYTWQWMSSAPQVALVASLQRVRLWVANIPCGRPWCTLNLSRCHHAKQVEDNCLLCIGKTTRSQTSYYANWIPELAYMST